jgi:hypothetical protein
MLYFAYGSNLCLPRLRNRVTEAAFVAVGELKGWRLVFNKLGRDDSAKANIERAGDSVESVWGVVFDIPAENWQGLRRAERFPEHYSEESVAVSTAQGRITAINYVGCAAHLREGLRPFDWYLEHVVRGGVAFALPQWYIRRIERIQTIPEPDEDRAGKERGYWLG